MNDRIKVGDEVCVYVDKNTQLNGVVSYKPTTSGDSWIIKADYCVYYVQTYKYIEKDIT